MRSDRSLALILVLFTLVASPSMPAAPAPTPAPQLEPQSPPFPGERQPREDPERARMEREQEKKRSKERFESLQKDTNQLLTLATELKQYVDKANEHTLSLDVIRKTDEIDKLAKSIREKMKGE